MAVEDRLNNLPMASTFVAQLKSGMHRMYPFAAGREVFNGLRNSFVLVRGKGGSKRRHRPTTLTMEKFEFLAATLQEPSSSVVEIAQCLGLRIGEIAAFQWDDFDFDKNQLLVQHSFVNGRVEKFKTNHFHNHAARHSYWTEIVLF